MRFTALLQKTNSRETRLPTCRSIPDAVWEQAREALVFYFEKRAGILNAEDLVQETLMTFWRRPDFEFNKEEEFLIICYAFAKRILKAAWRKEKRSVKVELKDSAPSPVHSLFGLNATEMGVYLDEVLALARSGLPERDLNLIETHASEDSPEAHTSRDEAERNRERVALYRARGKLAALLGIKKSKRKKEPRR
jgi:DNA-directed RNA polymerase specialized sigma24 family protein